MARERMIQARDLITAKRYKEARSLLNSIDHPTAREWIAKIDQLEMSQDLGDPFAAQITRQPVASSRGAQLLADAITLFAEHNWKIKIQTDQMVQFEKKKPVNSGLALILVVLAGILGVIIVALAAVTSGSKQVTLQTQPNGGLKSISEDFGTEAVNAVSDLEEIAKSVGDKINYGIILFLGIASSCVGYFLLSGMRYR
jgi:hypothetical protein